MISQRTIISGSTWPIFAIFSPNESVLGANDQSGSLFPISQGTLPWQPILRKMANSPHSSPSELGFNEVLLLCYSTSLLFWALFTCNELQFYPVLVLLLTLLFQVTFYFVTSYFYEKVQKYFCIITNSQVDNQYHSTVYGCWLTIDDWVKLYSQTLNFYIFNKIMSNSWLYQHVGLMCCAKVGLTLCKSTFYFVTNKYFSQPVLLYFYLSSVNHQYILLLLSYLWGQYLYFLLKYF